MSREGPSNEEATDSAGECPAVLHVTADSAVGEHLSRHFARHDESITYVTESTVSAGVDRFSEGSVDCVVSDHDGQSIDGIEFLEAIRALDPAVPFVLRPDEGSEVLASRAISAGVTEYVRTGGGVETLAARLRDVIADAVRQQSRRRALEDREEILRRTYEIISDRDRPFEEKVDALLRTAQETIGTDYATLSRVRGDDYVFEVVRAPDDSIQVGDVVPLSATNCERTVVTEETLVLDDIERDAPELTEKAGFSEWGIACYLGAPVVVEGDVYGTFCFYDDAPRSEPFSDWQVTLVDLLSRWISYELERQRTTDRLAAQNERLDQFASIVSHDLRSPLKVARTNLEMAQLECETDLLDDVAAAHGRMDALVEDLLTVAREGATVDEVAQVDVGAVATDAWSTVATADATLSLDGDRTIEADERRLQQVFENLFRNAVEHGSTSSEGHSPSGNRTESDDSLEHGSTGSQGVTVRVGGLPNGFYVEDDGPGIPAEDRQRVFEDGYTTSDDGIGLGLFIVSEIADAHDWSVTATESDDGGARFEFVYS